MKNKIINKPSFITLVIGSLKQSLGLKKYDDKIRQLNKIDKYQLLTAIKKEHGYMDCSVGCYTHKGSKFFIKTFEADKNDYRHYFIINEWLISNFLYKTLKSNKSQISTPKPIKIIRSNNSISLVYEFIEGQLLSSFSASYQAKIFSQIINELNKLSSLLKYEEIKLVPKRSIFFYLISLPYLSLMTFFRTDKNLILIMKSFLVTFKLLLSQQINSKLVLAHRDLKPHNVIVKDFKIFVVDTGRMVLTLPGYDLALLSLDPAHTSLTKSLEKRLKIKTNKFLKSYLAIQFADYDASVGMGRKYWEFLKTEYGKNTNSKKLKNIYDSNFSKSSKIANRIITKLFTIRPSSDFDLSKIVSKGILGFRYLYHLLFSNFYHLGSRVTFREGVTVQNGKHIYLGDKVYLEKDVTLKFLEEFNNYGYKLPNLKIEDGVTVSTGTIISAAKLIHIKKNVIIGPHCFIGDHDHEYRNIVVPIRFQGYQNVKKIVIEEGAWIAANSTICSGVTIGKNSVVGANSVVTRDVPDFSIAVGNPAKVVKKFNTVTKTWERISSPRVLKHRNRNIKHQKFGKSILGRSIN